MSRKKKEKKHYDTRMALASADQFNAHAQVYIRQALKDSADSSRTYSLYSISSVISSATMLSLSLELYLKCLHMLVGNEVNQTHHLWTLFKTLPLEIQEGIRSVYKEKNEVDDEKLAAVQVVVYVGKEKPIGPEPSLGSTGPVDIKSVLVRSSDAFETWRYFYEKGKLDEYKVFNYEFQRILLICSAVRTYISAIMDIKMSEQSAVVPKA